MRSIPLSIVGLGLGYILCGVGACSTDTTPTVYVDLAYQVRCLDCQPRSADDPQHAIKVVDGEDGYSLACNVKKVSGARRVTFSVSHLDVTQSSTDHAFKVSLGNIDADDTSLPCDVNIVEGANTYEGACTSDPPSDQTGPCQAKFSVKDGVISGGLYCNNIPNQANLTTTRYIVSPGSMTDPAAFKLYGCTGL
jgi:hypothetical protein